MSSGYLILRHQEFFYIGSTRNKVIIYGSSKLLSMVTNPNVKKDK